MTEIKIHSIYDAGDECFDRYTVFYDGPGTVYRNHKNELLRAYVAMSAHPSHPQGFGQHGDGIPGKHIGKRISFDQLPPDCQRLVQHDLGS